jgi:PleD family two-component response regulator
VKFEDAHNYFLKTKSKHDLDSGLVKLKKKVTILIVDDDAFNLMALIQIIEK